MVSQTPAGLNGNAMNTVMNTAMNTTANGDGHHHYILRGLSLDGQGAQPTLLARSVQALIPALLAELGSPGGLGGLAAQLPAIRDARFQDMATLKLFQPVHQTFYVVLVEALCNEFGMPRLAPGQIESAGMVVRRLRTAADGALLQGEEGELLEEGWMHLGSDRRGWLPLAPDQRTLDPDPTRRPPRLQAGHPEINRRLAEALGIQEPPAESTVPLFVAPPEVCAATGKTLLYGILPVTSSEFSQAPAPLSQAELGQVMAGLDPLLAPLFAVGTDRELPLLNGALALPSPGSSSLADVMTVLRLLMDLDALGTGPQARRFVGALNQVVLAVTGSGGQQGQLRAGDFLQASAARWEAQLDAQATGTPAGTATMVSLPAVLRWRIDGRQRTRILAALEGVIQERRNGVVAGERRFDTPRRRYRLHTFIRVRQRDAAGGDCPPRLVWGLAPSQPFAIAPWYESGDPAPPPVQIPLPDLFDPEQRETVKMLKPNVSFRVPEKMFNFLQSNNLDDLFGGNRPADGVGLALDWICSFNIPIITLCAFIVLSIFLALLDIVFWWLLFVKICLPIPKSK
ncbi:hypothetical protein FKZ61_012120 [Litorilinea aerophila]|uniref:Uncharacterized protein n=1 Tax=Litorilinea aerophila TaxID=1204385 RepID=A0A540VHD8_9CHLR|nr:hypothetical protein [Litorilinea aerophila]MCC9076854.1 hypothetical protein [Litorilinea aerophila]